MLSLLKVSINLRVEADRVKIFVWEIIVFGLVYTFHRLFDYFSKSAGFFKYEIQIML